MPGMVPPRSRRAGLVLVALVASVAGEARGSGRATLRLCISDLHQERATAALLARFLATVRLEAAPPPGCLEGGSAYVGWFDDRGGRLTFVLRARTGEELARVVPWVPPSPAPLADLAAADRLSEFSILVDGVLAEQRSPAPVRPPVIEPLPAMPPQPFLAEIVIPPPVVPPPTPAPRRSPPPRRMARATPPAPPAVTRTAVPVARPSYERMLSIDAVTAWVVRAPGLAGPQVGAVAGWRWLFLRAGAQASGWDWQGRQIAFRALTAEAGLRAPLLGQGRLRLLAAAAAMVESITLRRRDVTGAGDHGYLDAGVTAGPQLTYRPRSWARLSLQADGAYRPTGRRVEVAGGPSIALNAWSARVGVAAGLSW
jgi:hypothetical protein